MSKLQLHKPFYLRYLINRNEAYVTQAFGKNGTYFYASLGWKGHTGLDMRTTMGKTIWKPWGWFTRPQSTSQAKGNIPVISACDGVVTSMYEDSGGGVGIKVMTDEKVIDGKKCKVEVLYYHLHKVSLIRPKVSVGQKVGVGVKIGVAGNTGKYTTGAHLHFQIRPHWKQPNGKYMPDWDNGYNGCIDPMPFFVDDIIYNVRNKQKYKNGQLI